MMLSIVVVLPAPLRPTRQTDSFSPTESDTDRRICARPRYVLMPSTSSMALMRAWPEDHLPDLRILLDLFQNSARQDEALIHDHDAIGVLENDVHVVLDDHRRDLLGTHDRTDHIHDRRLLARRNTAGGLVEEEKPGLERV